MITPLIALKWEELSQWVFLQTSIHQFASSLSLKLQPLQSGGENHLGAWVVCYKIVTSGQSIQILYLSKNTNTTLLSYTLLMLLV